MDDELISLLDEYKQFTLTYGWVFDKYTGYFTKGYTVQFYNEHSFGKGDASINLFREEGLIKDISYYIRTHETLKNCYLIHSEEINHIIRKYRIDKILEDL